MDNPRSYDVHAETIRDGTSEAHTKQATILFDSSPRQGDLLPGPADLLTTAFAACVLKNVERMAAILPFATSAPRSTFTANARTAHLA